MFDGRGILTLEGDHLDLSFGDCQQWPSLTPGGSIRHYSFDIGDSVVGPVVMLGAIVPVEGEMLDWEHSIDPPHFHGSDQFRVIPKGEWILANKPIKAGGFAFQESGLRYREHPGGDGAAWTMLVVGDRRGIRPTVMRQADRDNLIDTGSEYDRPLAEQEVYPHPAGPRGIAAIATTAGPCERGYLWGRLDALGNGQNSGALSGVFGDAEGGPLAHLLKGSPGQPLLPEVTYATELLLIVTDGSCRIGDHEYRGGDIRLQAAQAPMPAIVAGPNGAEVTLIVADRRALPQADHGALPAWAHDGQRLQAQSAA